MASPVFNIIDNVVPENPNAADAKAVIKAHSSNELFFGVVGHVGSGTSLIAEGLKEALSDEHLDGGPFNVHILKARPVLVEWAAQNGFLLRPGTDKSMEATELLQDCGDAMRLQKVSTERADYAAVAKGLIRKIAQARPSEQQKVLSSDGIPFPATPRRQAYILDALRHPAEVELLRRVYEDAFILIGVACEDDTRERRLRDKFPDAGKTRTLAFMKRDASDDKKHGQRVADTFHLADYFLDNTVSRAQNTRNWDVVEKLGRLVKIVVHAGVTRPEVEETAMHHAYAAMMQSACLSRQVGAALMDSNGALIATGTNEVPKGGGGVYGEPARRSSGDTTPIVESRCALRDAPANRFCSNTKEQNLLVDDLIEASGSAQLSGDERDALAKSFRDTRVGGLLEFSRAVHAEMDALLTAGRTGSSTVGTRMFVTTFPCHYCARHLVTAGVDEVQYIEPYPKSLALKLHKDSICVIAENWVAPSQGGTTVLFRPFSGVAPRFYVRAFQKDRELKNKFTGVYFESAPEWGDPYYLRNVDYRQMEQDLVRGD